MNLTYLLNEIGITFISDDMEKYVSYSKIGEYDDILNNVFISSTNYDNNLDEAIKHISQNIQLKSIHCLEDCRYVLVLLNNVYKSLLIDQADFIHIYKGTTPLVQLTNDKKPNSNFSIIVDMDLIIKDLTKEYNRRRDIKNFGIETKKNLIKLGFNISLFVIIGTVVGYLFVTADTDSMVA
jgi:hypothetical protein